MRTVRIVNIIELLQVFKLMTILLKALQMEIANFSNHFNWYLDAFYFICYYKLIDCCRFCVIKLIKCNNYNNRVPQNLYVAVEHHVN